MTKDPFFIIGSGRSGNTLLRAILHAHGDVCIPPESYVIPRVLIRSEKLRYRNYKRRLKFILDAFQNHKQFKHWKIDLKPLYERFKHSNLPTKEIIYNIYMLYEYKTHWGDKTPQNTFYLDELRKTWPECKFIHIYRDPKDVVASYLNRELYPSVETAFQRWLDSVQSARKYYSDKNFLEVTYEELVRDPRKEIPRVCKFLEIVPNENMFNHHNTVDELRDIERVIYENVKKPISTDNIGKWKRTLTEDQKAQLHHLLQNSGYPTIDSRCEKCGSMATRFMNGFCGWVCDEWPECKTEVRK